MRGTLGALSQTRAGRGDLLRGATLGAMRTAHEGNLAAGAVVAPAISAARNAATTLGLSRQEAALHAAQAAVQAAESMGAPYQADIREAVLQELQETPDPEPEGGSG